MGQFLHPKHCSETPMCIKSLITQEYPERSTLLQSSLVYGRGARHLKIVDLPWPSRCQEKARAQTAGMMQSVPGTSRSWIRICLCGLLKHTSLVSGSGSEAAV